MYAPTEQEAPVVFVLTYADDIASLEGSAASLRAQSLQSWAWVIATPQPSAWIGDDPRVRVVQGAHGRDLSDLLPEGAEFYVVLEAGATLPPTTLEQWLWFLDAHPDCASVESSPSRPASGTATPRMMRRRAPGASMPALDGYVPNELQPGEDQVKRPAEVIHSPNEWLPEWRPVCNRLAKSGRRVLLVGSQMAFGGSDRFNLDLLDQLSRLGWDATVVATLDKHLEWLRLYARRTSDVFPLARFLCLVDYPRFLSYLIESRQPDVVLVTNTELGYRLLPYLRRSGGPAVVDFLHSAAEWNNGGYPRFAVEYQELIDLTVTSSSDLRGWLTGHGADADRIEVCYTNVDVDVFRPDPGARPHVRSALGIPSDEPVVMFAGRVSADKQPLVLAETIRTLAARSVRFTTLVAGDGPDLRWLRRFVKRHGLSSRVQFLGEMDQAGLARTMAASDVFFLPSRSEGIALTLFEAMACGLPVVAAAVGGQAELVTPASGILVERSTPLDEARAYAAALESLLTDPRRRAELGAAARSRVACDFHLDSMGDRMNELLEVAIERHRSQPRPKPGPGLARAAATEAVEITRLAELTDRLWSERAQASFHAGGWRSIGVNLFFTAREVGGPVYRWALARGWTWPREMKDHVQRFLIRS